MKKILFVCTHNRCRSILSEAIFNQLGQGQWQAFSAGSSPSGQVHPLSLRYLQEKGYEIEGLKSESWDSYQDQDIDLVVTVCDQAAAESCPAWIGNTEKIHWGLADPSKIEGDEATIKKAFMECISTIEQRCRLLQELSLPNLNAAAIKEQIQTNLRLS